MTVWRDSARLKQSGSPVDDHLAILCKHLGKTVVSVHARPTEVKRQNLAIGEFNSPDRIVGVAPLGQFRVTRVLAHGKYPRDLLGGVGGIGGIQEPAADVNIVDSYYGQRK